MPRLRGGCIMTVRCAILGPSKPRLAAATMPARYLLVKGMARGSLTFRQTDVTRALKAVTAAGIEVARIEIDRNGRIVIIPGKPTSEEANEWDRAYGADQTQIR